MMTIAFRTKDGTQSLFDVEFCKILLMPKDPVSAQFVSRGRHKCFANARIARFLFKEYSGPGSWFSPFQLFCTNLTL